MNLPETTDHLKMVNLPSFKNFPTSLRFYQLIKK